MSQMLDVPKIRWALGALQRISPDHRLLTLKNLCENNGIWSVPELPGEYQPVFYEIQLFGVPASVMDIADLPRCWMKAAQNILEALPEERAA